MNNGSGPNRLDRIEAAMQAAFERFEAADEALAARHAALTQMLELVPGIQQDHEAQIAQIPTAIRQDDRSQ